jgi:hypothetical protein
MRVPERMTLAVLKMVNSAVGLQGWMGGLLAAHP